MTELTVIFVTTHPDTIGNSYRLNIIRMLSNYYSIILLTNCQSFIVSQGIKVKQIVPLVPLNTLFHKVPILNKLLYEKQVANQINQYCPNSKLFIFHDTANYLVRVKYDIHIYTLVHQIHEFEGITKPTGLRLVLQKIQKQRLLKGLKRSNVCFVVSSTIEKYLRDNGIKNEVIIAPHCVSLDLFQNPCIRGTESDFLLSLKSKGKFIITYTGWVSENRGFSLMLEIIKLLVAKDCKFVLCIVGCQEDYINKINLFTKQYNLKDNLFSFGRIDSSFIPMILHNSDLCLSFLDNVPGYQVSPPQKIVEYFAAGKPVIANHIPTHELLINDGVNGLLLDDSDSIVPAIIKLSSDTVFYKTLCDGATRSSFKFDEKVIEKLFVDSIQQ